MDAAKSPAPRAGVGGLAKFSCDSCRQRKLKCTREIPKCGNCKQWTGNCTYSHTVQQPRKKVALSSTEPRTPKLTPASVEDRLSRIESSIDVLTNSIQTLTHLMQRGSPDVQISSLPESASLAPETLDSKAGYHGHTRTDSRSLSRSPHLHPTRVFSPLPQASLDLESVKSKLPSGYSSDGSAGLKDLSKSLSAVHFDFDKIREQTRQAVRSLDLFYIPSKEQGQFLIKEFLQLLIRGTPLYMIPDEELQSKIVFEPSTVTERGWVLLFNFLLYNARALQGSEFETLKSRLRWNTWVALEDSSLFLEPSEANVQAILTLAIHGDDFTTPSMSWTLVSHACRLAQALNLHSPDQTGQNRRVLMFWALFTVDKRVSLAFGRPPMLPSEYYESATVPGIEELVAFSPHRERSEENLHQPPATSFGALFFLFGVELAKLTGKITHFLHSLESLDEGVYNTQKMSLKADLDTLRHTTIKGLIKARDIELTTKTCETERKELNLGIDSMAFQFHHLLVLLTRHDEANRELCLQAARDALILLPKLVSTSENVYNGIVWQLLYHPFNPFFVLFGNIIRAPELGAPDVKILRSTVSYFSSMVSLGHQMASKLKDVAHVFASLANHFVRDATLKNKSNASSQSLQPTMDSTSDGIVPGLTVSFHGSPTSSVDGSSPFDPNFYAEHDLLNWFTGPDFLVQPNIMDQHNFMDQQMPDISTGQDFFQNSTGPGPIPLSQSDLLRSLEQRSRKRPLECTFDWFSWDMNNTNSFGG